MSSPPILQQFSANSTLHARTLIDGQYFQITVKVEMFIFETRLKWAWEQTEDKNFINLVRIEKSWDEKLE